MTTNVLWICNEWLEHNCSTDESSTTKDHRIEHFNKLIESALGKLFLLKNNFEDEFLLL